MSYRPEFARLVEEALMQLDRPPAWLAQRLGVSQSTVSRWLNHGARPRNPETVVRVADALGMTSQRRDLLTAAGFGYHESRSRGDAPLGDGAPPPHNLPSQVTSLVGRDLELSEITQRLATPDCRLITLWGPGGIGKTRLALAAAQVQLDSADFPDGVFHVPLVPLSRPEQIVPAIAAAIDFPLDSSGGDHRRTPEQQLLDFLRKKWLLLLLDNLEHLPEAGSLITCMLEAAEGVKVLATSRERLRLPSEHLFPLAGLSYPLEDDDGNLSDHDAPKLFLERARQSQPDFAPTRSEADDLLRICRVVDGMPLALELAAVWIDTLALGEIRNELEASPGFLSTDAPGAIDRHRSMQATFDASWQRLSEEVQRAFARLSVFRGGFTRTMAAEVAGATLPVLSELVGKSFVRFNRQDHRYDVHELMRQYGAQRLAEDAADEERTRDRHAAVFCGLMQWGYEEMKGHRQSESLSVLSVEQGNVAAAWDRAVKRNSLEQIELAMDGLGRYYEWSGNLAGGVAAFSAITQDAAYGATPAARKIQAHAGAWLANFEFLSGESEPAEQHLSCSQQVLDALETAGDDVRMEHAFVLLQCGHVASAHNLDEAIAAYGRSRSLYQESGHRWETAVALAWQGRAMRISHSEAAIGVLNEVRVELEKLGDQRTLAIVLEEIAQYQLLIQSDLDAALRTAIDSLQLRRDNGDQLGIASSLSIIGSVYNWQEQAEMAEQVLTEALSLTQRLGHRAGECRVYRNLAIAYKQLGKWERRTSVILKGLAIARELESAWDMSTYLRSLGNDALIQGDYESADSFHSEMVEVFKSGGLEMNLPWPRISRTYSAWKVGRFDVASEHMTSALRVIVDRENLFGAVHALLLLAQVMAAREEVERAVEIGASVQAVSRWKGGGTRLMFLQPLEELTSGLSPDLKREAEERGRSRNIFDVAEWLLHELEGEEWRWTIPT